MSTSTTSRRRLRATVTGLAATAVAVVGLALPANVPAADALTRPAEVVTVGHSSAGTLITTTQDFNDDGLLELVRDDGTRVWRRTLAGDPTLGGTASARNLSLCADTVTSRRDDYDQNTGTTTSTVYWSSTSTAASGSAVMAQGEIFVSAARGGWVTETRDGAASTTSLTLHRTDGTTLALGTVDDQGVTAAVCDDDSVVVGAATYERSSSVVRLPFDGSGPVVVRTETYTSLPYPAVRPISVHGTRVLGTTRPENSFGDPQGSPTVWVADAGPSHDLLTVPADQALEGGAAGPDGDLVCLGHADLSQGCDTRFFPTSGAPVQAEVPYQSGRFWATDGGFVEGCDGGYGGCTDLYRVATPALTASRIYQMRVAVPVVRWGGADRYAVAATIAQNTAPRYGTVFLASGSVFADALSVGAPGARFRVPVLLTGRDRLPASTVNALDSLAVYRLVVVGGTGTISNAVYAEAAKHAFSITRVSGSDRYAVAASISKQYVDPGVGVVYVVSGQVYPDGLVASAPAARDNTSILLTQATVLPAATRAELVRLHPAKVVVIGGPGSVGPQVVTALEGVVGTGNVQRVADSDRYTTAAAVSRYLLGTQTGYGAYLAAGTGFADALSLGPATRGVAPILLTAPASLHPATAAEMQREQVGSVTIAGGTGSVSATVVQQIADLPDLP